jgi:hypothetical protein
MNNIIINKNDDDEWFKQINNTDPIPKSKVEEYTKNFNPILSKILQDLNYKRNQIIL